MTKILYIEDHPVQRDIMAQLLNWYGFEVAVAQDGLAGLDQALEWLPDLIITDLRMPGMTGFEVIERIRRCEPIAGIPIIALSTWASGSHQKRALSAGANGHFTKPINFNRLLPAIRACLARKSA